jgi:hypothetical protein
MLTAGRVLFSRDHSREIHSSSHPDVPVLGVKFGVSDEAGAQLERW